MIVTDDGAAAGRACGMSVAAEGHCIVHVGGGLYYPLKMPQNALTRFQALVIRHAAKGRYDRVYWLPRDRHHDGELAGRNPLLVGLLSRRWRRFYSLSERQQRGIPACRRPYDSDMFGLPQDDIAICSDREFTTWVWTSLLAIFRQAWLNRARVTR